MSIFTQALLVVDVTPATLSDSFALRLLGLLGSPMHPGAISDAACQPSNHTSAPLLADGMPKETLWQDSLAEWSKAVDSSSIIFGCVGSFPTAVICFVLICAKECIKRAHPDLNQGPADLQSAALATELCTHAIH